MTKLLVDNKKKIVAMIAIASAVALIAASVIALISANANVEDSNPQTEQTSGVSSDTSHLESASCCEGDISSQASGSNTEASNDVDVRDEQEVTQKQSEGAKSASEASQSCEPSNVDSTSHIPSSSSSTSINSASSPSGSAISTEQVEDDSHISVHIIIDGAGYGDVSFAGDVKVEDGDSVYDALKATGVSINARESQYGIYVAAIGGLAEKSAGGESGWKYSVGGVEPNCSCGKYILHGGEKIKWKFVTKATESIG